MSTQPQLSTGPQKEQWASKIGVVLAVAGSAVGLGNFLRFPGQAVNNGGGAFLLPYMISFLLLGIPICWCEWTMGRLGGRFGQSSGPGIYYALVRHPIAKVMGGVTLIIPTVIYMYYIFLEAWCLSYCLDFMSGSITDLFSTRVEGLTEHGQVVEAVVTASGEHHAETCGTEANAHVFGTKMIYLVLACGLVNFFIIYQGVTKGIERFCKYVMPLLVGCAMIILVRVLTLPNISTGLGFMWNPQWDKLLDADVWVAAASQIFFSLSVGFGLILTYASYLGANDDVTLSGLSAASTNEFCEVVLGGMIVVPTAFLFLGAQSASAGTFGLGFQTVPAIMHFMPGGQVFGALWFGLLFFAGVTSSLSMLQPAIAFLEEGFGLRRRGSVILLALATAMGTVPIMYFSRNYLAMDTTDFWVGNLLIYVAATAQVLTFGWIIGAKKGVREANRGGDIRIPDFMAFIIRYVTPTLLLVVFVLWLINSAPSYVNAMRPEYQGTAAARAVYEDAIAEHVAEENLDEEALAAMTAELLGAEGVPLLDTLPVWLRSLDEEVETARTQAAHDATVCRMNFIILVLLLIFLIALCDMACRRRFGPAIERAEAAGAGIELE